jgi:hypothetical protein
MAGSYEHSNESSGTVKAGNFFTGLVTFSLSRRNRLHGVNKLVSCCMGILSERI